MSESSYYEIWDSLKTWSEDNYEINLLTNLQCNVEFSKKEKPLQNCYFQITGNSEQYVCDLYWEKSKVAFFTADNKDCYLAARGSDTICFCGSDNDVTPDLIFKSIKEDA